MLTKTHLKALLLATAALSTLAARCGDDEAGTGATGERTGESTGEQGANGMNPQDSESMRAPEAGSTETAPYDATSGSERPDTYDTEVETDVETQRETDTTIP